MRSIAGEYYLVLTLAGYYNIMYATREATELHIYGRDPVKGSRASTNFSRGVAVIYTGFLIASSIFFPTDLFSEQPHRLHKLG